MSRREVFLYVGWCSGPGNPKGLRALLTFFGRPRRWLSVHCALSGDIALRHWRWGMIKWGFDLREVRVKADK